MSNDATFLTGQMLVAMPSMGDPRFAQSVVFICSHDAEGAMGLIVNKPIPGLRFSDLSDQIELGGLVPGADRPVMYGGPVERNRGFVLHSPDYEVAGVTQEVTAHFRMTATVDVLQALASGTGPEQALLALGYSGWGPGQLERELAENGWLTVQGTPDLAFAEEAGLAWTRAMTTIGIDPRLLSSTGGRV